MSGSNHSGCLCGNQNVQEKFLNQNGRQFRLYYEKVDSGDHVAQAFRGKDMSLGGSCPLPPPHSSSYVPVQHNLWVHVGEP